MERGSGDVQSELSHTRNLKGELKQSRFDLIVTLINKLWVFAILDDPFDSREGDFQVLDGELVELDNTNKTLLYSIPFRCTALSDG